VPLACLAPAGLLVGRAVAGRLGADPVETLLHTTGDWALRFLLLSLAVTPARRLLGWSALAPQRRTLGLAAFGYASLHALAYVVFDQSLDFAAILDDVAEHLWVTAGLAALVCLTPLALTSTRSWIRRLGRRWVQLHRLVYVAAVAAVVHFLWLVKSDHREPLVYAGVLSVLLGVRAFFALRERKRPRASGRTPATIANKRTKTGCMNVGE